jgi:hypothetical protein
MLRWEDHHLNEAGGNLYYVNPDGTSFKAGSESYFNPADLKGAEIIGFGVSNFITLWAGGGPIALEMYREDRAYQRSCQQWAQQAGVAITCSSAMVFPVALPEGPFSEL